MNQPKKSLGQHWLTDKSALQAICDAGQISKEDVVLEIGPGHGSLTRELVKRAKQVIAVELDEQLFDQLSAQPTTANVQFIHGDILKFDFSQLPEGYKIVANIPYYLTSHLLRVLSETANPPTLAVLLVQKEVAERVTAKPGDMSLLSVTAQFYWQASKGRVISAQLFDPPPKIDSQILILKRRTKPLFEAKPTSFFRLVKAGFSSRRKTLLNSLSGGLRVEKTAVESLLGNVGIQPATRAQSLSLDDWRRLYQIAEESKLL